LPSVRGPRLPPSENLLEIEKDLVSRGFLRERSLSARQSDTSAGLTGEKQIFCDSFYLKLTKGGTSPWRNKIAADVLFVFSKNGERYARHEDGSQIKIE